MTGGSATGFRRFHGFAALAEATTSRRLRELARGVQPRRAVMERDGQQYSLGVIGELNELIAFERAAVDACEAAAGRVADIEQRARLRELVRDHWRNVEDLSRCVADLGGAPTHDKRSLPGNPGPEAVSDGVLLLAVLDGEERLIRAYGEALVREDAWPIGRIPKLIRRAAEQHERRRAWLRALVPPIAS